MKLVFKMGPRYVLVKTTTTIVLTYKCHQKYQLKCSQFLWKMKNKPHRDHESSCQNSKYGIIEWASILFERIFSGPKVCCRNRERAICRINMFFCLQKKKNSTSLKGPCTKIRSPATEGGSYIAFFFCTVNGDKKGGGGWSKWHQGWERQTVTGFILFVASGDKKGGGEEGGGGEAGKKKIPCHWWPILCTVPKTRVHTTLHQSNQFLKNW